MKKINLLTRKFIHQNIKVNTTVCSYPIRTVTSPLTISKSKDITNKDRLMKVSFDDINK
ncbi:hypothetical protein [Colwellia sp. 75C3]|uniref:hypothetical protein n=1 Tax=Colwellia sp. 75C3 TaxID=888425 RepID=UPI0012FE844F|nr:hypothetical protein [Colwellia sp. 75C3]